MDIFSQRMLQVFPLTSRSYCCFSLKLPRGNTTRLSSGGSDNRQRWVHLTPAVARIEIHLGNAVIHKLPDDIPNEINDGHFTVNGQTFNNMIASSMVADGDIEVSVTTFYGNELRVTATNIAITEVGKAEYLQKFEAPNQAL